MLYPVLEVLPLLKTQLLEQRRVILQAPPGAGKSTVLPLQLLNEPWLKGKKVIMLEPRRLAARAVAMRMAELRGEAVGQSVGYRVRFESRVGNETRIEVVTEGILTRMLQSDNALEECGLVIFDEFHERSLHADLALALCLQVQQVLRDDLRILIMSATLDTAQLAAVLKAPVVTSMGRQHPVAFRYLPLPEKPGLPQEVSRVVRKALRDDSGDLLVFLPGVGEIQRTAALLETENLSALICPLFGDLNFKKQQEAIMPHPEGRRKVVLATSIAETSLTIEGVSVVIDSGYARVPRFDPRSGFTRLETIRVTRDAADQRAGRAGRLAAGICYRLWSEGSHHHLVPHRNPEILDADLAPLMLELCQWGIAQVDQLTWMTPPPPGAVSQAMDLLQQLGAVDGQRITDKGRAMLRLPTHPRIAHMLLEAQAGTGSHAHDLALAADIAALLEERDPLPKGSGSDLSLRIDLLRKWRSGQRVAGDSNLMDRIEKLAAAWRSHFRIKADNQPVADTEVGRWVMAAYPERIGRQTGSHSERYKTANGRIARLPDHDALHREPWLAIAQLDAGGNEGRIFLAAPLDEKDLDSLAEEKDVVSWDADREMITAARERRIGHVQLSSQPLKEISDDQRIAVICGVIREKGLAFLGWTDEHRSWQARISSLRHWRAAEAWPDVSDHGLLQSLDQWFVPFLGRLYKRSELQKLDLMSMLPALLPWDLQGKVQALAPERMTVPSGSSIRLQYHLDGSPPAMEVRLQEVFGWLETPSVNEGKNRIVMHLLSPGYKPVQVTQDLRSFWGNTYAEVRKELRARYPKHSWPEDPWTAQAVRGAKRRN